jgi:Uma2 family endonuclease
MTTAEYLDTPETVLPRELAYGVMHVADAPSVSHQRVVLELALHLAPFVRASGLGELMVAPTDVILDFEAGLVVQPDLLVVSESRRQIVADKVRGAPDLVIEVLSPFARVGRLDERLRWFARYGVRECWLVAVPEKQVSVLTPATGDTWHRSAFRDGCPIRSDVMPGLALKPLQIFGYR